MNLIDARTALVAFIRHNIPVALAGAPGIGKSEMIDALTAFLDDMPTAVWLESLNLYESVDLRGLPLNDAGNVVWSIPEMFQKVRELAASHGRVILFLDEWNTAHPSVMICAAQLVNLRRVGPHFLPDNVVIVAAGNRRGDKASANATPTMLNNRFAHLNVEADAKIARAYYESKGYDPVFCAFFGFRPNLIHVMPKDDSPAFPSPRSWEKVAKVMHESDDLRPVLVRGLVGESAAAEFESWMLTNRHVPKLADIVADPTGTRVPGQDQPALQYATCAMCAANATRQNFGALITYIERIGKDLSVAGVYDATTRDRTLMQHPAFIAWAARNADVTT